MTEVRSVGGVPVRPAPVIEEGEPARRVAVADASAAPPVGRLGVAPRLPAANGPVLALTPPDTARAGPTVERAAALLAERIAAANVAIADPANQIPALAPGQGIVRVNDARNQRVEWRIDAVESRRVGGRDEPHVVLTNVMSRRQEVMTVEQLRGLLLRPEERLEVRESADLTAARVPSVAEQRYAEAVSDTQQLTTLRMRQQLGDRDFRIFQQLATRRAELVSRRDAQGVELRAQLESRGPIASVIGDPFGRDQPLREAAATSERAVAEIDRALASLAQGRGIDFVPREDGVTVGLHRFRESGGDEPLLRDRLTANAGLLRGAAAQGQLPDAWLAYQGTVQPYLFLRGRDGDSIHQIRDATAPTRMAPSLTLAVNRLIAQRTLGDRRLVTSADELVALRGEIERNWTSVVRTRDTLDRGALYAPGSTLPFDAAAFDAEVARLRRIEAGPEHQELRSVVADANSVVPDLVAREPGLGRRALQGIWDITDNVDTWVMVGVGVATAGAGAALATANGIRTSAQLIAAARAAGATPRGVAALTRGSAMFAAETAVDGALFHSAMNLYYQGTSRREQADWSLGGFARSTAMLGVSKLAASAHLARLAQTSPAFARRFAEHSRYFGEELTGQAMVSVVSAHLAGQRFDTALHEIESNAQMMLAMRGAFAAQRLLRDPRAPAIQEAQARTQAMEAESRRLIYEGARYDDPRLVDALGHLGRAYQREIELLRPPLTPVGRSQPDALPDLAARPRAPLRSSDAAPVERAPLPDGRTDWRAVRERLLDGGPAAREMLAAHRRARFARMNADYVSELAARERAGESGVPSVDEAVAGYRERWLRTQMRSVTRTDGRENMLLDGEPPGLARGEPPPRTYDELIGRLRRESFDVRTALDDARDGWVSRNPDGSTRLNVAPTADVDHAVRVLVHESDHRLRGYVTPRPGDSDENIAWNLQHETLARLREVAEVEPERMAAMVRDPAVLRREVADLLRTYQSNPRTRGHFGAPDPTRTPAIVDRVATDIDAMFYARDPRTGARALRDPDVALRPDSAFAPRVDAGLDGPAMARRPPPNVEQIVADHPTLRDMPEARELARVVAQGPIAPELGAPLHTLMSRLTELGETRPEVARALADRAARVIAGGDDARVALQDLSRRANAIADSLVQDEAPGSSAPFRRSLPIEERNRRLAAAFDLQRPLAETLRSFPERAPEVTLQGVPVAETQRALDAEPPEVKRARARAFAQMYRQPWNWLERWAQAGDEFARKATLDASKGFGLSFRDIDTAAPMAEHRRVAAQSTFELNLGAPGRVQTFEPPPTAAGVPPYEIQAALARPYRPGRPTLIYLTEATSAPFDASGRPLGTIRHILGEDGNRLGDVNVVLIRSPHQAAFPNGPVFTAGFDNIQSSLATTTQFMDNVVRQLRRDGSGPIVMGGYSLGGANINQYRGWFDDGRPGSGADFYIPMGAPEAGYGGLFDSRTNGGNLTWLAAAQLAPNALPRVDFIAEALSPSRAQLDASGGKVFALVPRWDDFVPGIDESYGPSRMRYMNNGLFPPAAAGHLTGATEGTVPTIPGTEIPFLWPAMGSVDRTANNFRDVFRQYLGGGPISTRPLP